MATIICPRCEKEINKAKILAQFSMLELQDRINYLEVKEDLAFEDAMEQLEELHKTSKEYDNDIR